VGASLVNTRFRPRLIVGTTFKDMNIYGPFEDGAVIAWFEADLALPGAVVDVEYEFVPGLALPKTGPATGRPVLEVLPELVSEVREVVIPNFVPTVTGHA
jgi:hypothetical protein